jgi:hypothetical protein
VEAVNKEDFSKLFKSCYLVAVRSNRNEKLNAAAALLANLLLKPGDPAKFSYDELDHLVWCLEALSIGAIAVLGAVRKLADSNENRMIKFNLLQDLFPQFEFSLLMSLVSELRALNLVRVQDEGAIRMPDRSGIGIELAPIGRRFFERFSINGAVTGLSRLARLVALAAIVRAGAFKD